MCPCWCHIMVDRREFLKLSAAALVGGASPPAGGEHSPVDTGRFTRPARSRTAILGMPTTTRA